MKNINKMKRVYVFFNLLLFSLNCLYAQNEDWQNDCKSTKVVGNLKFTFPSEVVISDRDYYIQQSINSIKECLTVIKETKFIDSITVEFFNNREDMKKYLGHPASGMAFPNRKTMFCVVAEKTPIKHEWAHMVTMLTWGYPARTLIWLNEGLATYIDNCSKYSREEIYAYFIKSNKLIGIDDLVYNFQNQDDVIAYFQASYLVEYLISKYDINKLKYLWQSDINNFEEIYGVSFANFTEEIRNNLQEKYPATIELDWEELKKGCY